MFTASNKHSRVNILPLVKILLEMIPPSNFFLAFNPQSDTGANLRGHLQSREYLLLAVNNVPSPQPVVIKMTQRE